MLNFWNSFVSSMMELKPRILSVLFEGSSTSKKESFFILLQLIKNSVFACPVSRGSTLNGVTIGELEKSGTIYLTSLTNEYEFRLGESQHPSFRMLVPYCLLYVFYDELQKQFVDSKLSKIRISREFPTTTDRETALSSLPPLPKIHEMTEKRFSDFLIEVHRFFSWWHCLQLKVSNSKKTAVETTAKIEFENQQSDTKIYEIALERNRDLTLKEYYKGHGWYYRDTDSDPACEKVRISSTMSSFTSSGPLLVSQVQNWEKNPNAPKFVKSLSGEAIDLQLGCHACVWFERSPSVDITYPHADEQYKFEYHPKESNPLKFADVFAELAKLRVRKDLVIVTNKVIAPVVWKTIEQLRSGEIDSIPVTVSLFDEVDDKRKLVSKSMALTQEHLENLVILAGADFRKFMEPFPFEPISNPDPKTVTISTPPAAGSV